MTALLTKTQNYSRKFTITLWTVIYMGFPALFCDQIQGYSHKAESRRRAVAEGKTLLTVLSCTQTVKWCKLIVIILSHFQCAVVFELFSMIEWWYIKLVNYNFAPVGVSLNLCSRIKSNYRSFTNLETIMVRNVSSKDPQLGRSRARA